MKERRRYFRIDETIGITYHVVDGDHQEEQHIKPMPDALSLVSQHDEKIQQLMSEVARENPKVAQLVALFNQKLERIVNHFMLDSQLVGRIARRVKEANISACGIAFENDEEINAGARLNLELTIFPSEKKILAKGIVVSCKPSIPNSWYWRIDFYGMSDQSQELLIQHIVKSQGTQLKKMRGN